MFNVLQQPPPSVSICKTSVVISAYCTYLNNSNSEPHPDTNTNRKRCKVNLKGRDFRELMGIADKQKKQLDKAIEIASTRLHASLDKQLKKQAPTSQSQVPTLLTEGPSKQSEASTPRGTLQATCVFNPSVQ
jgi:hypothetical protein